MELEISQVLLIYDLGFPTNLVPFLCVCCCCFLLPLPPLIFCPVPTTGMISNIPKGMVTDQFGMIGLLTFIRAAETEPNLVTLALGRSVLLSPVACIVLLELCD